MLILHTQIVSGVSYLCRIGRGQDNEWFKLFQVSDITACQKKCSQYANCIGFDYGDELDSNNCRLHDTNFLSIGGGLNLRKYCRRITEGKMESH